MSDDAGGIAPNELELAIARHCTSKLVNGIDDIRSLGFRGEALPSIGAVSRLSIRSRTDDGEAAEIAVEGGRVSNVRPAGADRGTTVEVRDLFFATPARLKFMKGERAEATAIADVVRRIAIAFPQIRFTLFGTDRSILDFTATNDRFGIAQVMGAKLRENSILIDAGREACCSTAMCPSRPTREPMRSNSMSM